ncbi:MAG: hypothetical protein IJ651_00650 [Bacteroidales bacterium]|nr:hypothetical protein [Bacteroidales bacterium]
MGKTETKELYFSPETQAFGMQMEGGILTISGKGAGLFGAGVDESDADSNGSIW